MLPPSTQAAARWAKILLLAAIALFFTLVAFTNITDFDTNYSSNQVIERTGRLTRRASPRIVGFCKLNRNATYASVPYPRL